MNDKLAAMVSIAVTAAVLVSLGIYMMNTEPSGSFDTFTLPIILLIIVAAAMYFVVRRVKAARAGLPAEDELSKKAMQKAGYYAYLASIWIALGTSWFNTIIQEELGWTGLDVGHAVAIFILLPALIFLGLAVYFNRKGSA